MTRRLRRLLPGRWRLRLWLARDYFRRESYLVRRAQPSRLQRRRAARVLERRARALAASPGPVGIERLPAVAVVNLASRPERLEAFLAQTRRLGIERVERVEGVPHELGAAGCAMAHVSALRRALAAGRECAMVCEDDVVFRLDRPRLDVLVDSFLDDDDADVACLAYFASRSSRHDRLFLRGHFIRTAACYLVKRRVAPELVELWERGIAALERGESPTRNACDKAWFPLQERRVFLIPIVRAAQQAPGWSDIERRVVSYSH